MIDCAPGCDLSAASGPFFSALEKPSAATPGSLVIHPDHGLSWVRQAKHRAQHDWEAQADPSEGF